jgi:hypothetical protein
MIGMISPSVGMGLGSIDPCVIVHKRIAQVMSIREGDEVEFEILEAGERFSHKVLIKDGITADVIVHGALFMHGDCEMRNDAYFWYFQDGASQWHCRGTDCSRNLGWPQMRILDGICRVAL